MKNNNIKIAYLAGGCFWGLEELFRKHLGVIDTQVGYMGGENDFPTYENHTNHAETVKITYNSKQTSFKNLLLYFFRIHNPTTLNQQGNDIGSSYRSAIFYQNNKEKNEANEIIQFVNNSKKWKNPLVTTLEKANKFWPAEEYHQDYLQKNPNGYTCHYEYFPKF